MKDYYAILEIPENADGQEIKKAYRKLVKKYHPDAAGKDAAKQKQLEKMYAILQEAYECLGDEEKRKRYDEARKRQKSSVGRGTARPGRQNPVSGQTDQSKRGPIPNMGQFERFFGFRPGDGLEAYQDKQVKKGQKQGPVCPDEIFRQFFGVSHGRKG